MHELGIVMHLIRQVEDAARENSVTSVRKVVFEAGEVSGIVPNLFEDAFDWARMKTKYLRDAVLELVVLEAVTYCTDCACTYKTTEHGKKCPYCGGENTYLVTGDEMKIREIEVV